MTRTSGAGSCGGCLQAGGHDVVEPGLGISDAEVWEFAQASSAVVLTGNAVDFEPLARSSERHAGLLLVYQDADPRRDMTAADIAAAVRKVDTPSGGAMNGQVLVLNRFRR